MSKIIKQKLNKRTHTSSQKVQEKLLNIISLERNEKFVCPSRHYFRPDKMIKMKMLVSWWNKLNSLTLLMEGLSDKTTSETCSFL